MEKSIRKNRFFSTKYLSLCGLLIVSSLCLFSFKSSDQTLCLTINNITKDGTFYVTFCRNESEWTENGKYTFKFNALTGRANSFLITTIPSGIYSVALYQDLNGNKKLDTNLFGIPKEPYAFSNNQKPFFSAPSFEECSFNFHQEFQTLTINLLK